MVASAADVPKVLGGGTVVASAADIPNVGGGGTMVASAADIPNVGGGGTMVAVGGAAVPAAVGLQHSAPMVTDLIGTTLLGRYEVLKKLGEGGMGTVYLSEHTAIKKKFAIKVLSHEFAHKQDLRERFLQEARAASMISQQNVVEITDFGDTPNGSVFFVMEHLKGEDLSDTVKSEGRLPWARVKPIIIQICRALSAAHAAGIIHRDMKPENCYRISRGNTDDFIKVLDFGIAKVTSDEEGEGKGLTRTGMIFGTPEYMSPEQAQGAKPDHRVDVYAVGVIMYELLTGRVPFIADTFMGILTKHMFEVPEAPSSVAEGADIPPEVEAIILKAMQKDRELRFDDMAAMSAAIEAVGTGAGAVDVVTENIARPSTGQMAFTGGRNTVMPGTVPPVAVGYEQPKSNKGLWIGIVGGLVAAAAGVGLFLAFAGDKKTVAENDPVETKEEAVVGTPVDDAVEMPLPPEEKVVEIAPGIATVNYHIATLGPDGEAVAAKILDTADNAIYGMTNSEDGVEVRKSEDPIKLTLRAEGFLDRDIEIIPIRDKNFEFKMVPVPVKEPTKATKKTSKKTPDTKPDPETDKPDRDKPKADTKTKGPRRVSPDLKDPFGSRG